MMPWYPATRARVLMNTLYINRDVIRSQAKLSLLFWNPCVVFKYKLILLHLMCFFLAINTSLRQLIILSGSGVPPCCLPFGNLWPPQSPHQPSGLSRLFTGTRIFHSFKIWSHIFKESWWGVENLKCDIWAFTGMVSPKKVEVPKSRFRCTGNVTEGGWYKEIIAHLCQEHFYLQTNFVKQFKNVLSKIMVGPDTIHLPSIFRVWNFWVEYICKSLHHRDRDELCK